MPLPASHKAAAEALGSGEAVYLTDSVRCGPMKSPLPRIEVRKPSRPTTLSPVDAEKLCQFPTKTREYPSGDQAEWMIMACEQLKKT
jgi:hypothetical protein